jgi:hypothetical protein
VTWYKFVPKPKNPTWNRDEKNNHDDNYFPSDNEYTIESDDAMDPGNMHTMDHGNMMDHSDKENYTALMPCVSETVTYQHIQECSSKLARTCQNDQQKMRTILCNLNRMIERVRDGHDIFILKEAILTPGQTQILLIQMDQEQLFGEPS